MARSRARRARRSRTGEPAQGRLHRHPVARTAHAAERDPELGPRAAQRGGTDEAMRGLAAIERNGKTQARMISDLLDMSRLNLGKLPLTFVVHRSRRGDRRRPSTRCSRRWTRSAIDGRPALRSRLPPHPADASRLQQVIWNLLSNAIKFSPEGQHHPRSPGRSGRRLARVRSPTWDRASRPVSCPFVFDRFAQSDAPSNRHRGGLGLGLSIVKQLVEAHGGSDVGAERGPGQGHRPSRLAADRPRPCEQCGRGSRGTASSWIRYRPRSCRWRALELLVVDDDREASAMLKIILSDRGAAGALRIDGAGGPLAARTRDGPTS